MSLYNTLATERGYSRRIWPVLYPDPTKHPYEDELAPLILRAVEEYPELQGTTVEPGRFSQEDLMERMASYGRSGFALQFLLDTNLSDAEKYPLKCSDLIVTSALVDEAPEKVVWTSDASNRLPLACVGLKGDSWYSPRLVEGTYLPYDSSWMAIDPSGRGTDETSYAIGSGLNGYVWLLSSGGFQEGYTDATLEGLVRLAKKYKVRKVMIEENYGGGLFKSVIEPWFAKIYPVTIEEVRSSKQKEHRIIDTLEPLMNQHRLIVSTEVVEKDYNAPLVYQLFYQMTHLTRDKGSLGHDDRLDALAMLCACFVEDAKLDVDRQQNRHRDKLMQEELRGWLKGTRGPNRLPRDEGLAMAAEKIKGSQRRTTGALWSLRGA
jgi:hypothetical protein